MSTQWIGMDFADSSPITNGNTLGTRIRTSSDVSVQRFGIKVISGTSSSTELAIWDRVTQAKLWSGSIGTVSVSGWRWVDLPTPLTLIASREYSFTIYNSSVNVTQYYNPNVSDNSWYDTASNGITISYRAGYDYIGGNGYPTTENTSPYTFAYGMQWEIPNVAPNAPGLSTPVNGSIINTGTPTFSWSFSDQNAGDQQMAFQVQASTYSDFSQITGFDSAKRVSNAQSWSNTQYPLNENLWYYRVRTWDGSDVASPWSWVPNFRVDLTLPTATGGTASPQYLNVPTGGTFRVQVTGVSDNVGISNVQFPTWTNANGQNDINWYQGVNAGGGTWYVDVPIASHIPSNAEDLYITHVYAYDTAGNNSMIRAVDTYVDRTAPTISSVSAQQYIKTNSATVWAYNVTDTNVVSSISVYAVRPDSSYYLLGNMTKNGATNDYYYNVTDITIDGNWHYDFRAYDAAGNVSVIKSPYVFRDTVVPTAPTQTNGVLYATSNGVSWTAFSDGATSSGLLLTTMNFQSWNGSVWNNVATYPKSVTGLTHSFTGLAPGTQYRWGITYTDNASNVSTLNYTTFTTNSYSVSTFANLSVSGYLLNQRPKIKFIVVDVNDSTLTNFQIQISTLNTFASTVIDATYSVSSTGWGTGSLSSGSTQTYIPQTNIGIGTFYVRARAYDGKDWGIWSATGLLSLPTVSWPTTIASDDSTISKRTIDDIRIKINAVREARGLAAANWTNPIIYDWSDETPTLIRTTHLIELRQAIVDITSALSLAPPVWTDNIIDTSINRKGIHWTELRDALINC
jgi:hypothetical protein